MSTKHFCDVCGDELVDANTPKTGVRLQHGTKAGLWVDVHTGFDEHLEDAEHPKGLIWNHGEFCKYCVIDAVKELDNRPRQGPPDAVGWLRPDGTITQLRNGADDVPLIRRDSWPA